MAELGLGYGSEFQLLRFMGRHRNELDKKIKDALNTDKPIEWIDFEYSSKDNDKIGDSELIGTEFLKDYIEESKFKELQDKIIKLDWKFNQWQNWDAVFKCDDTIYFVEAKAHKDEFKSGEKVHGGSHSGEILKFMKAQFGSIVGDNWMMKYYQFANRISTIKFLNSIGLKSKVMYICFIDGYDDQIHDINKNTTEDEFIKAIAKEKEELGLDNVDLNNCLAPTVFIDARPNT